MDLSESKCQFFQKQVFIRQDLLKCNYSLFSSVNASQNLLVALGAAWEEPCFLQREHVKNTPGMNSRCSLGGGGCKCARLAASAEPATIPAGLLMYESSWLSLCRQQKGPHYLDYTRVCGEFRNPRGRRVNRLLC